MKKIMMFLVTCLLAAVVWSSAEAATQLETFPAERITQDSAELVGMASNFHGAYFKINKGGGEIALALSPGAFNGVVLCQSVTGLTCDTTYYARIVGWFDSVGLRREFLGNLIEFTTLPCNNAQKVVRDMYLNILGRAPQWYEVEYWAVRLDSLGEQQLTEIFKQSDEHAYTFIQTLGRNMLCSGLDPETTRHFVSMYHKYGAWHVTARLATFQSVCAAGFKQEVLKEESIPVPRYNGFKYQ